jgi:hypothetical protein
LDLGQLLSPPSVVGRKRDLLSVRPMLGVDDRLGQTAANFLICQGLVAVSVAVAGTRTRRAGASVRDGPLKLPEVGGRAGGGPKPAEANSTLDRHERKAQSTPPAQYIRGYRQGTLVRRGEAGQRSR